MYYKCGNQASYKNGKKQQVYCHNNTVRKEDIEKHVIKQVKKIIFNERIISDMLEEYYTYAKEASINTSLVEMLENKVKDIENQMNNIVGVISAGHSNQLLLKKLDDLTQEKKLTMETLSKEQSGGKYDFPTREEILKVYKKAKNILDNGSFEERKKMLQNFINKIYVYKDRVDIYLNLVPMMLIGYINVEINHREVMTLNDFMVKDTLEDETHKKERFYSIS